MNLLFIAALEVVIISSISLAYSSGCKRLNLNISSAVNN
jgi:hypothetical protein